MKLTPDHTQTEQNFCAFLSSTEQVFFIDGPGGVGKTTLLNHLIKTTIPSYRKACTLLNNPLKLKNIYITATQNKAVAVLNQTGFPEATTIHSLLGLTLTTCFKTGDQKLTRKKSITFLEDDIIFIDECSKMDRELLSYLGASINKTKLVFIGDRYQAPPVKEKESSIYSQNPPMNTLTEILRTDIPGLKDVYMSLREEVRLDKEITIPLIPGLIEHLSEEEAGNVLLQNINNTHVICYANNTVINYNQNIRESAGLPIHPQKGDILTVNSFFALSDTQKLSTDSIVVVTNFDTSISVETVRLEDGSLVQVEYNAITVEDELGSYYLYWVCDKPALEALSKKLAKQKEWRTFYFLQNTFVDLRFTHALTAHKAQGSSYDNVIIDLNDINRCTGSSLARILMYVAVTRARKRVILFGSLAPRIGTIL